MTEELPTVIQSLARVMEDVNSVAKKERNSSQGFNFRGIDSVVNAVAPALRKHSVVVIPSVTHYTYGTVEIGKNRTPMSHVIVEVTYTFLGARGDSISTQVIAESMDSGDKAIAKAMSVAFRTALIQALALPTDEPDPDTNTYERSESKPKPSDEDFNKIHSGLVEAESVEQLLSVAKNINTLNFSDDEKESFRQLYTKRLAELNKSEEETPNVDNQSETT